MDKKEEIGRGGRKGEEERERGKEGGEIRHEVEEVREEERGRGET